MNNRRYDFKSIESKWQKKWISSDDFHAVNFSNKPKYYLLVEFPYPSGEGLHVGHLRSYVALDIVARKRRKQGYNVLYPMGWDAFGLPAENYAIKNNVHPRIITEKNISNFKKQLQSVGLSFDWKREVNTTAPEYCKWTQWIFSKFFEKGLAVKEDTSVNWCTGCKCVLANEEVVNGACERCGSPVVQKQKKQWVLKITEYAQKLLDGLNSVDYPYRVKLQQSNWIGKSDGAMISFKSSVGIELKAFTTRPDTIFGVSYIVVAPESSFLSLNKDKILNYDEVIQYQKDTSQKNEFDRLNDNKEKTGVKLEGIYAVNPVSNENIPIFISDYVLSNYGTGVVMGVPAHDERDFEFAKKYNIEVRRVIDGTDPLPCVDGTVMINSGFLNGLKVLDAKEKVIEYIEKNNIGHRHTNYKLRDWIFSRQRYWGEPIPVINCENCGPVLDKNLPLMLPDLEKFTPSHTGESPLCKSEWINVKCPKCGKDALRETDTMPQWAGSSWYFLRYLDPDNDKELASKEAIDYWMPVDWYNGGMEHTTLHLLYSRFWYKFLNDIGTAPSSEPYAKRTSHGIILGENGEKMSKSRGNVVNPNDVVSEYGADVIRLYEMFIGDFEKSAPWSTDSIKGCKRFLDKYWNLQNIIVDSEEIRQEFVSVFNESIKKVSDDIENLKFNTSISCLMNLINQIKNSNQITKKELEIVTSLLNPFAPHVTSEIWDIMKFEDNINFSKWPDYDEKLIDLSSHNIVIQINGKIRDTFKIDRNISNEELVSMAKCREKIISIISDKQILKEICVPNKLVNLVVK